MEDKLQNYRQPLMTAAGVFLGFVLSIASSWAVNAFKVDRFKEEVVAVGLWGCISLLLIVIYRVMNINYPKDKAEAYFKRTLYLFIAALSIAFLAIFITMIESFIVNR